MLRNKIILSSAEDLQASDVGRLYLPYDLARPEDSGLTSEDVTSFGLKEPQPVVFDRGVFLTEGQHKGVMLRTLLAKSRRSFKAILFIDDRLKHHDGMKAAFAALDVKMVSAFYRKTASAVQAFQLSDKRHVNSQWCFFAKGLLESVYAGGAEVPFHVCGDQIGL